MHLNSNIKLEILSCSWIIQYSWSPSYGERNGPEVRPPQSIGYLTNCILQSCLSTSHLPQGPSDTKHKNRHRAADCGMQRLQSRLIQWFHRFCRTFLKAARMRVHFEVWSFRCTSRIAQHKWASWPRSLLYCTWSCKSHYNLLFLQIRYKVI